METKLITLGDLKKVKPRTTDEEFQILMMSIASDTPVSQIEDLDVRDADQLAGEIDAQIMGLGGDWEDQGDHFLVRLYQPLDEFDELRLRYPRVKDRPKENMTIYRQYASLVRNLSEVNIPPNILDRIAFCDLMVMRQALSEIAPKLFPTQPSPFG